MNILMVTNVYLPQTGGVQRSVAAFSREYMERGHNVLVVTPAYRDAPAREDFVVRVPAVQKFNGSDFSLALPIPGLLRKELDRFEPTIVHSHQPFFLGDTALRIATHRELPLVHTYHTMLEHYTYYVPADSEPMQRFVVNMAVEYANLCDHVIAPSRSVADVLVERGVESPLSVIPTGVDVAMFRDGDGTRLRRRLGIPGDAFAVGYVGRLAPEKNLEFLARAVGTFLQAEPAAHFVVVGEGPSHREVERAFRERGVHDRLHLTGALDGQELVDAYHALDVFAFASRSETQGMVLAEAMAAGVPVVALDGPGVRDVVDSGNNGLLVLERDERVFASALSGVRGSSAAQRGEYAKAAAQTAERLSLANTATETLAIYSRVAESRPKPRHLEDNAWTRARRVVETEWQLWSSRASAAMRSLTDAE